MCSLSILLHVFVILVTLLFFHFGFESWIWVLIASFPDLCILFTFMKIDIRITCYCNNVIVDISEEGTYPNITRIIPNYTFVLSLNTSYVFMFR